MTETIFLRKILLWLQKVNLILSKISMRLFHTVERWITLVLQAGCLKAVKMSLKLQLVRTRPGFIISTQTNLVCQWSVQKMNFHPLLIILQLEQLRNSLVPGGWWLVAGCWWLAALLPTLCRRRQWTQEPSLPHTGEWWGPTLETMGQTLHLSCHSTFHHMLRPYCALYLTVWAALLIISYLYSVQLET